MLEGSKYGRKQDDGYVSASDEEILPLEGISSEDEDSEDEETEEISDGQDDDRSILDEEEREEIDHEAWGSSRKVYYGADDVSDEEDEKLEEQEAERLQKKHLSRLRPEDFLDTWADTTTSSSKPPTSGRYITEELPAPDFSKLSKEEVLKLLKSRHPDVPRLAGVYQRWAPELVGLGLLSKRPFHPQHRVITLQYASLSVLLGSIAMLFAVRADSKERKSMEKKIIAKIAEMENLWSQISTIPIDKDAVDVQNVTATETKLDNLLEQSTKSVSAPKKATLKRKRQVKTLADDDSDDDLTATLALLKKSRKVKSKRTDDDPDNDYAESKFLNSIDAQEKSQNRKSLQFYTAKIAQKEAKRREKYSGDMEVYKERRNDRNERQIEAARKRGLQTPTIDSTALTTTHADSDNEFDPHSRQNADPDSEYYDFIAGKTAAKKANGKEVYETSKAAARAYILGMTNEAELDESGKRLITRQIEKNKGLTPKRSKDVRNPRVKKRKKYEKKKIALKGRQQVYVVGDRRRGNYGGEESGISKNVVKGVKLQ